MQPERELTTKFLKVDKMGTEVTFQLADNNILQGLAELRTQELLCDVRLEAEGATFPAHKAVLAAASPYFHAMFTGGFKEASEAIISMKEASSEGLRRILSAMYSSEVSISDESLEDVLSLANQFQMKGCLEAGEKFLCNSIAQNNCLRYLSLAEKYELSKVVNKCEEFIEDNFETISKTSEFNNICLDKLCQLMSDKKLRLPSGEIEVYRAAMRWLEYNCESQTGSSGDVKLDPCYKILEHVRFHQISPDLLLDEVMENRIVTKNEPCKLLVKEALRFHSNIHSQPLLAEAHSSPRGDPKLILMTDETQNKNMEMSILGFPIASQSKYDKVEIPFRLQLESRSVSTLAIGNYILVFGTLDQPLNPIAMRYDIIQNNWLHLAPLPSGSKFGMAICRFKGDIFICGGSNGVSLDPKLLSSDFHRYSIKENCWSKENCLPKPLVYPGAKSYGNYVYVAGGSTDTLEIAVQSSDSLYAYDIVGKLWLTKAKMCRSRAAVRLESWNGHLYAMGGVANDQIEMYSIMEDQWTYIPDAFISHSHLSTVFIVGKILYILGGEDEEDAPTDICTCLDMESNALYKRGTLPFPITEHCGHVVIVPRK